MRIYLKYEEILENSINLQNITKEYEEIIANINKTCENINQIWISDNKNIEFEELTSLNTDLKINNNYYKLFAEILKSINEDFLLTEQEASKYMMFDNIKEVTQ